VSGAGYLRGGTGALPRDRLAAREVLSVIRILICRAMAAAVLCVFAALGLQAQMVSPSIDPANQPFSYFSAPTDEIGVMDAPEATEITPEGYLYTGFGELMFFTGPNDTPVRQRLRTLERGYLPIDSYIWRQDGIAYTFTVFAATLDGTPEGQLVDFIRVTMRNESGEPTRALLASGMRHQGPSSTPGTTGDNRFRRPVEAKRLGDYRQPGVVFSDTWEYRFDGDAFLRDGKGMYVFPPGWSAQSFTLHESYNNLPNLTPRALNLLPTTAAGIARYSKMLAPGEAWTLDFRMPVIPAAPGAELDAVRAASFDAFHAKVVDFWEGMLGRGMQLTLPEKKVTDTFRANLIYDLIARNKIDGNYVQTVNDLHYHAFWLRDSSDIVHSYDITGYPTIARQVLDFFPRWQTPDGNFLSQSEQYDGWGETLWAYGQHFRITHDRAFAEQVFPSIVRAVAWLHQARAGDPLHLMPASNVRDNENVPGHITGYNFLALDGLHEAILMAQALGKNEDAATFQREYDDYRTVFLNKLDEVTQQTGGYIPPALDTKGGYDWGNLLGAYPEPVLAPSDPRITATLRATQARYQEGIISYGDGRWIHHYLTIKNTLTEVERGDQQEAVRELYALLLHTSSTQAGFEYAIRPWGDRNFEGNLSPHGWFAAEYRTLVRNLFVREQGRELHLLSVVSPEWIGAGKKIDVERVPTDFGTVSLTLEQPDDSTARLAIRSEWGNVPQRLVLHLPWFMETASVTADGHDLPAAGSEVALPPGTHTVEIHWKHKADAPRLSYQAAVDAYKAEYLRRYNQYMHGN
jgi:hypothetical protein